MFDDDYPTCARTYATLRIYPGEIDPSAITERLGIEPSREQTRGEVERRGRRSHVVPINGWFLESRGQVESRDSRRHIDWLLDRIGPKAEAIRLLRESGCGIDVSCFWLSKSGHGGPTVSPSQMKRLAELDIELWFDFYESCEEPETVPEDEEASPI